MSDYLCSSCNEDGMVCIPRAQHEALEKAAKALAYLYRAKDWDIGDRARAKAYDQAMDVITALRAAGIPEGE